MGLSIHYSGAFDPAASLSALIEEVKEIAELYKWKYSVFETEFPAHSVGNEHYNQEIYGIYFAPPQCEPVWICFLSNGKMSSPSHLKYFGKGENKEEEPYLYMISTKTQYAGVEIHKLIIHLFKYLERKYFQDFTMKDEGNYWETGDEKLLQDTFKRYTAMMEGFASALEIYPMNAGEGFEQYFKRLMNTIRKKRR